MYFQNVKRLDANLGKHIALACCCPCCAAGALKSDARKKYNIDVGVNTFKKGFLSFIQTASIVAIINTII